MPDVLGGVAELAVIGFDSLAAWNANIYRRPWALSSAGESSALIKRRSMVRIHQSLFAASESAASVDVYHTYSRNSGYIGG